MARVFVGMSGGVDSSTAAALLVRQGHDVVGITLALLPEQESANDPGAPEPLASGEGCCDASGARRARAVCDVLGIAHYTWNARDAFAADVIGPFARAYGAGLTPNPCIDCNDRIKFGWMLDRALASGADALATGHYARVTDGGAGGPRVRRAADVTKDQSYFLYRCTPRQLADIRFPLGDLTKADVRALAADLGLPSAATPESQEICFAPDGDYAGVVSAAFPEALVPGEIVALDGRVLGTHRGLARYTVGQRQGLSLSGGPWYVARLEPDANRVVVGPREALDVTTVLTTRAVWSGPRESIEAAVALRYRMEPVPATVTPRVRAPQGEGSLTAVTDLEIALRRGVPGVAPGQAAVVYAGQVVLGGGVVSETR